MSQSPHQIIAIDDNASDTLLLRMAFDQLKEPYVLTTLTDGQAAIRYLKEYCGKGRGKPCLIIIDLHLPTFDGVTLAKAIRDHSDLSDVAIAILTSQASPLERDAVHSLGVNLYRNKPLGWDDTLKLGRELFDICKAPEQSSVLV